MKLIMRIRLVIYDEEDERKTCLKHFVSFQMNKTLIIDTDNNHCFIMPLDRKEIEPPRDFMQFINRLNNGIYQLDLDEVRHDTRVVLPPIAKVDMREYG